MKKLVELGIIVATLLVSNACKEKIQTQDVAAVTPEKVIEKEEPKPLSDQFKKYWYNGTAEITSYNLQQARYGELRQGSAVMVFVTEPFNTTKQVKADKPDKTSVPVLKLNSTKKFNTGIYPYSVMSSTFYPVGDNSASLKITNTVQEWCGQVFSQLNNKENFEVSSYSYFESEGDEKLTLKKDILENDLWAKIRINPNALPKGKLTIIPSFQYIRFSHKQLKAYNATAKVTNNDNLTVYSINYPELQRNLSITFTTAFPHTIESFTETHASGFGANKKMLTTKATLNKRIQTAYWQQNRNKDLHFRDSLGL
ncbi:septum formation inhibitor Maf [Cellulophaga omnivescoria]|uniref:septum formation inhibitor Maf n=1 Tax=Cellulophaga omnivescoria TaxID=1888890 RepID=UPI0022F0BEB3|nr:septum formation inhibitor Maf [Cellulophaga omnivescoria]WBU89300.1 septum formation inhibitor Maf [Cellulophaga omnivescoria]